MTMLEIAARQASLPTEAVRPKWAFRDHPLLALLVIGMIGRLIAAFAPGHQDVFLFAEWANDLAARGSLHFYNSAEFRDYLPGYLYVLWFMGEIRSVFGLPEGALLYMIKLPSMVADMASALLLYKLLEGQSEKRRLFAVALYLSLPPVLFIGAVWGQIDSILVFLLLLTIYYFRERRPVAATVAFTVAFLVKPQAIAALPALAVWALRHYDARTLAKACAVSLGVALVMILPFFPQPLHVIGELYRMSNMYHNNAMHSLNFWSMWGWDIMDNHIAAGADFRVWAMFLTFLAYIPVITAMRRAETVSGLALGVAVSILVFYTFQTRMHERYDFAALLPMLFACMMMNRRSLWAAFAALTTFEIVSLAWAYGDQFGAVKLVRIVAYTPANWGIRASPAEWALSVAATGLTLCLMALLVRVLPARIDAEPDAA